jgi:hypothetical protein
MPPGDPFGDLMNAPKKYVVSKTLVYLHLFAVGAGPWSVDDALRRRTQAKVKR